MGVVSEIAKAAGDVLELEINCVLSELALKVPAEYEIYSK